MTAARPAPPAAMRGVLVAPGRLQGVDVARALALLGMMAAHIGGIADEVDWSDPATWSAVAHGRPSTLFAVLAGVSIGLTSGQTDPPGPPAIGRIRARLAIRAVAVVAVGLLLMALGTPVYVILPTYGALFLLVLPALRWRPVGLLVAAAVCALSSPVVALAVVPLYAGAGMWEVQLGLVYPVVTFLAYVLVGLAVARVGLGPRRRYPDDAPAASGPCRWGEARRTQVALFVSGALVAVVAYVLGNVLAPVPPGAVFEAFPGVPWAPDGSGGASALAQLLLSPRDHSSSVVDVVGTAGVAVAVIALCTLVFDGRGRTAARIAFPLAAVGSMPLTVYAGHLVVIALLPTYPESGTAWALFASGSVVFAMLWRAFLGSGPLERLIARLTRLVPTAP
ncbi:heparan-alpha-glucosaminide N-acetyltransferase domain-containing protein [Curtobacterium sp. RHCJP20]|uniref:Heparan-alpha-glucosaminide N-acetyltransferase domain-containing protein n=1 Tax=Curtobacterium subtropicum TaxID=3055138 RepID=A0ABT7THI6_9MICO|nr:heparan-alpha-glucosaminide N-acetyltransferase domain-containing protein [Curtobacterium subtropicum]MDM7889044.1 heparan-alpha-glucosaminide N-acetyltransferase domain-containing protein [Curtobacterium subtropicum]